MLLHQPVNPNPKLRKIMLSPPKQQPLVLHNTLPSPLHHQLPHITLLLLLWCLNPSHRARGSCPPRSSHLTNARLVHRSQTAVQKINMLLNQWRHFSNRRLAKGRSVLLLFLGRIGPVMEAHNTPNRAHLTRQGILVNSTICTPPGQVPQNQRTLLLVSEHSKRKMRLEKALHYRQLWLAINTAQDQPLPPLHLWGNPCEE